MEETGEPSPPFAIVLSNLWIAYGFIQTVLERRPGDVHRLVRVVIEFQQVREQKGLCYSIYSYGTCHDDTGYFGVYTALGRETEGQALDTILAVIREPTEHGVTQAELDRAREQSKANVLMGLESAQCWTRTPSSPTAPRFGAGGFSVPTLPSPGGRCPGGADEGRTGNLKPNLREM